MIKILAIIFISTYLYSNTNVPTQIEKLIIKQQKDIANLEYEITQLKKQMLMLYERHNKMQPKLSIVRQSSSLKQIPSDFKLKRFKPSTFKLIQDENIVNLSGVAKRHFKKGDAFTSTSARDEFIKISGRFENGKWISVKKDLYVSIKACKKR